MIDTSQATNLVISSDVNPGHSSLMYNQFTKDHHNAVSTVVGTNIPSTTRKIPIVKSGHSEEEEASHQNQSGQSRSQY